jgi:hypothetical protein
MSVSLMLHASINKAPSSFTAATTHFIAFDDFDQDAPELDLDAHAYELYLRVLQPLATAQHSHYKSTILAKPFSCALQRGPPRYLI